MSNESTGSIILSPRLVATGNPAGQALENIITNVLGDGAFCYVSEGPGQGEWQLEKGATDPPDGVNIVEPISGPGRWYKKLPPGTGGTPGTITSVVGINNITTIDPTGPVVTVDGGGLLPRITIQDVNSIGPTLISDTFNTFCRVDTASIGAPSSVRLPPPSSGKQVRVKDVGGVAGVQSITVLPNGAETIDGEPNQLISTDRGSQTYISDGTNWDVV